MKWVIFFVSSLVLSTIATAQNNNRAVSNEETVAFKSKFESISAEDNVKWNLFKAGVSGKGEQKDHITAWIQPSNKKELCKIYFNDLLVPGQTPHWNNKENRYYWDGDCKNGYAYGIGREFEQVDGGLRSALADYKEVNKRPIYYLNTDYDRNYVRFSAEAPPYYASLSYTLRQQQAKNEVLIEVALYDLEENNGYFQNTVVGSDEVHSAMSLPNQNKYIIWRSSNPAKSTYVIGHETARAEKTGYNIIINDDGINKQLRHLHYSTDTRFEDVLIPSSYLTHLSEVDNKITKKLNTTGGLLEEAYVAINKYRRKICKGDVKVNFVDNEIYGRICLESGEMYRYSTLIQEANRNMKARHQAATEEIVRKKENLSKERQYESARQDRLTEQAAKAQAERQNSESLNRAAQAQENRQNSESLNHAVSEFARNMEDVNRRSSQFTQSFMNSFQTPPIQFGNTRAARINCINISNIISCR